MKAQQIIPEDRRKFEAEVQTLTQFDQDSKPYLPSSWPAGSFRIKPPGPGRSPTKDENALIPLKNQVGFDLTDPLIQGKLSPNQSISSTWK